MNRWIISIILGVIISISATCTVYAVLHIEAVYVLHMEGSIGDYVGFSTDTDAIRFGTIPKGGLGTRNITITNNRPYPLSGKIYVKGDIKDMINVPIKITVNPNSSIDIQYSMQANSSVGNYSGKSIIVLKK